MKAQKVVFECLHDKLGLGPISRQALVLTRAHKRQEAKPLLSSPPSSPPLALPPELSPCPSHAPARNTASPRVPCLDETKRGDLDVDGRTDFCPPTRSLGTSRHLSLAPEPNPPPLLRLLLFLSPPVFPSRRTRFGRRCCCVGMLSWFQDGMSWGRGSGTRGREMVCFEPV